MDFPARLANWTLNGVYHRGSTLDGRPRQDSTIHHLRTHNHVKDRSRTSNNGFRDNGVKSGRSIRTVNYRPPTCHGDRRRQQSTLPYLRLPSASGFIIQIKQLPQHRAGPNISTYGRPKKTPLANPSARSSPQIRMEMEATQCNELPRDVILLADAETYVQSLIRHHFTRDRTADAPRWLSEFPRHLLLYIAQVANRAFFEPQYRTLLINGNPFDRVISQKNK